MGKGSEAVNGGRGPDGVSESVRRPAARPAMSDTGSNWTAERARDWQMLIGWCQRNNGNLTTVSVPVDLLMAINEMLGADGG